MAQAGLPHKTEQLNIRASAEEKKKLALAAGLVNMNLSQFVLSRSLEAAEEVVASRRQILVSEEEFEWVMERLAEPPRDLPELRKLLSEPTVFDT